MLEILRNVDYNPHFFHIHTFNSEEEKWSEWQIISTQNRGKRTFINYPKKFREEEFEKIRQRSFENFPSRYTCLFLSEDMDTAKFWLDKLFNRCNFIQFVEVELLSGKYVYVDEQIYNIENFSKDLMIEEANSYWSGEEIENNRILTILFEGRFRVCNVKDIHNINDIL